MGTGSRLLRNATFLTVGDKIGYLLQFVFFLYYAKTFGVIPVGEYSFAFFFTYACAMMADSGVSVYLVREVARKNNSGRQLLVDCLLLRTVSLIIVTFIGYAILKIFFTDISIQKVNAIAYLGGYWFFNQIADIFLAELNGHEKMGRVAFLGILSKVMFSGAGILLIYLGINYDLVLIAFPISGFIYMIACIAVSIISLGPIHLKFNSFTFYKNFFIMLLPFFFTVVLIELINCQDILLLGIIKNDQSVGIYSSAIKLVAFITGIAAFIQIAMSPVLSKLFIESREKLIDISNKILRYSILISLPLSFGMALIANKIITLLYTDSFAEASIVLKIGSWTIIAVFIQTVFSALLTAINRQKEKVIFIAIAFVISTLLNIILIYRFDFIGATIVKFITSVICLAFFAYLVSKFLTILPIMKFVLKPLAASLVMSLFLHYFYHLSIFYQIPIAGLIYLTTLLLLGTFSSQEILLIKKMIPERLYNRGIK